MTARARALGAPGAHPSMSARCRTSAPARRPRSVSIRSPTSPALPAARAAELSALDLRLLLWTVPKCGEVLRVRDAVLRTVWTAYSGAGIEMPTDSLQLERQPHRDPARGR